MADPLAKLRDRNTARNRTGMSTTRSCEGCDVCCTAPEVKGLSKPPATPCAHLSGPAGRSCSIYGKPERPPVCRNFYCLWRAFDHILPDWMAPKDCGFVVIPNNMLVFPTVVTVHPMPDQPMAWMTLWHQTVFAELAIAWNCIVAVGQSPDHTVAVFAPNGLRMLKGDFSPDEWAMVVHADGYVGVPDFTFGPDRRPLINRLLEVNFTWGIRPPA